MKTIDLELYLTPILLLLAKKGGCIFLYYYLYSLSHPCTLCSELCVQMNEKTSLLASTEMKMQQSQLCSSANDILELRLWGRGRP
jgi:hypothetical protein